MNIATESNTGAVGKFRLTASCQRVRLNIRSVFAFLNPQPAANSWAGVIAHFRSSPRYIHERGLLRSKGSPPSPLEPVSTSPDRSHRVPPRPRLGCSPSQLAAYPGPWVCTPSTSTTFDCAWPACILTTRVFREKGFRQGVSLSLQDAAHHSQV